MEKLETSPILGQWTVIEKDAETGNVISVRESENIVVNTGKTQLFNLAFISGATGQFLALGVGASSTPVEVTDSRLTYELIGNPTRKQLTSNFTGNVGNPLTAANDISLNTVTIGANTYTVQIVAQCQFLAGDLNNGSTFYEYGVFTSTTLPSTPTSTSGIMLNHYLDPNPLSKGSGNVIQIVLTLRL